ncbi:uncharacterized protein PG986_008806 [Apiospora aurea]|uniref:Uncharacterized protein n=1 Tax=Apiospora aurea TaxID=335848 RepID=A0ABR1Q655_9PEZI
MELRLLDLFTLFFLLQYRRLLSPDCPPSRRRPRPRRDNGGGKPPLQLRHPRRRVFVLAETVLLDIAWAGLVVALWKYSLETVLAVAVVLLLGVALPVYACAWALESAARSSSSASSSSTRAAST